MSMRAKYAMRARHIYAPDSTNASASSTQAVGAANTNRCYKPQDGAS